MQVHLYLYGYTSTYWGTPVLTMVHLYLSGYTCTCQDTPVLIGVHLYLSGYTCTCQDTPVLIGVHLYFLGYYCTYRSTPVTYQYVATSTLTAYGCMSQQSSSGTGCQFAALRPNEGWRDVLLADDVVCLFFNVSVFS